MLLGLFLVSCGEKDESSSTETDNFDRTQMLTDWADIIIIPAYQTYTTNLDALNSSYSNFEANPNETNLEALRLSYFNAYRSWQKVSMFEIGKAEEIGLRNFTNVYPTDSDKIEENIATQVYNLDLPSNFVTQGFPALDYLLYGAADSDEAIVLLLQNTNYAQYVSDLLSRLTALSKEVLTDWETNYRTTFIENGGSSATASVDKMVNDFLFYYEKYLRAGKIGIPAGVFSGNTLPDAVEAPYSATNSKVLFDEGFEAVRDFFVGKSFYSEEKGSSLSDYLAYVASQNESTNLANSIETQWTLVTSKVNDLSANLNEQVITDNSKMLAVYDELQKAVVLMKVDMMQALNIQVDYVDADGD